MSVFLDFFGRNHSGMTDFLVEVGRDRRFVDWMGCNERAQASLRSSLRPSGLLFARACEEKRAVNGSEQLHAEKVNSLYLQSWTRM